MLEIEANNHQPHIIIKAFLHFLASRLFVRQSATCLLVSIFCISMDDFGTGYSSLAYLKNLPLNTLKIDRSFLSETVPDEQDKTIISAIIAMAHSMGLRVVAEGVEGNPQRTFLHGLDCDEIQGYLISKPVPGEEALKLLHLHNGDGMDRKDARKLA